MLLINGRTMQDMKDFVNQLEGHVDDKQIERVISNMIEEGLLHNDNGSYYLTAKGLLKLLHNKRRKDDKEEYQTG